MKYIYTFIFSIGILFSLSSYAQQTGSFEKMIPFNMGQKQHAYFVPSNYNPMQSYPLIIGLEHMATRFRDTLTPLSDSLNAIILCPDVSWAMAGGAASAWIKISIDTAIQYFNIDTSKVYLTGFSMYGFETFYSGFQPIYPFAGIIPLAAYMPSSATTTMNFESDIPSCICIGTADSHYTENQEVYDTLIAHGQLSYFNPWQGIGHTYSFPGFIDEMVECFNFFDTIQVPTTASINSSNESDAIKLWPNPVIDILTIELNSDYNYQQLLLSDLSGRRVYFKTIKGETQLSINVSSFEPGIYLLIVQHEMGKICNKIIIN